MKKSATFTVLMLLLPLAQAEKERINQEGRILGPLPMVTDAILFNTTNADVVVTAMQIFPVTNPWNEDISHRPLLANSDAMIARINSDLTASHSLTPEFEMNFVLVPDSQMLVSNQFVNYPDDSDLNGGTYPFGLYPIPTNMPIEKWPVGAGRQTLLQWQTNDDGSDRHSIIVQPGNGLIWETWNALRVDTNWQAGNGAIFNLNTNALRMAGLTSGDAAGLPMFPALVRYDEAERGMVEHACRIVVKHSRKAYIYPATHDASVPSTMDTNVPAMGQRVRLKASFAIPESWTKEEKAVLRALKKYGALVADNGNYFSISVTPDDRWPANCFDDLSSVAITNFEVIQTTGPNEGPRSAGAPVVDAGPDQAVPVGTSFQLQGAVAFSGVLPVISWKLYSGPGTVTFSDATLTNTTASFSAPGMYTLEVRADDGVHAVAYDAVVITVTNGITVFITLDETNANLSWTGGSPPYVVQWTGDLPVASWNDIATTSAKCTNVPLTDVTGFFRVIGQQE